MAPGAAANRARFCKETFGHGGSGSQTGYKQAAREVGVIFSAPGQQGQQLFSIPP